MKNTSSTLIATLSLVAVLAVPGCNDKKGGGTKTADCSGLSAAVDRVTADNLKKLPDGEGKQAAEEMAKKMMPIMKNNLVTRCGLDHWAQDAVNCGNTANTQDDVKKCQGMLTPEQKNNLDNAMAESMSH